jgi:hypothetical protein
LRKLSKMDWGKGLTETFSKVGGLLSERQLHWHKLRTSDRLVCLYFLAFNDVPRLVSIEVLKPK